MVFVRLTGKQGRGFVMRWFEIRERLWLVILACACCSFSACSDNAGGGEPFPPRVILSSDVATGLLDTHGGRGSCPVSFNASSSYMDDADFAPQDVDDGFTLAMALNMDAAGLVKVEAVIPTYGNASLPAEMLVARKIAWDLKGRTDLPIVPGAMAPAAQIIGPTPQWFDGQDVFIFGSDGSFAASCRNSGVDLMREKLLGRQVPATLVAIGPLTDIACLLTIYPEVAPFLREIIVLASRTEGESLTINGKVVNDFNFRMDPMAGTLFLAAGTEPQVPIRLMSFQLTGQTSQADDLIPLDASTLKGPSPPTPASTRSLTWLLESSKPRNEYWSGIFGTQEGPFDQYAVIAAVQPDLFDCRTGWAYVQQCPYPAWSPEYPTDAEGNPTEEPYNTDGNACIDHGSEHGSSLSQVPVQLVVTLAPDDGPLVRGATGIDGNIPQLAMKAREIVVCVDFASSAAREHFEDLLLTYTW
jgi:inosine-uridine nucleoside N-ribohydrolase